MAKVHVMDHPLIAHKISYIRSEEVGTKEFREMIGEIAQLMCYEATRDLKLEDVQIKTPICEMTGKSLAGKKLAIVPILRAGLGMVDGFLTLIPAAKVGVAAIQMLKDKGVKHIRFVCIIAAPEGVERMKKEHPDVDLYIGSLDEKLNDHGYIVPGLGDAGDRIFGTK